MISITEAVLALDTTAQISTVSDDANDIIWHDGNPNSITNAQIQTKQTELQTAYDAKAYARTRADAYPSIGDQLDMLWHAVDADATLKTKYADFHTAIKTVKDATPKP
jgi:hypothetical protein